MVPKKSKKADLESKRGLFFQIGLAISMGLVLLAFEYGGAVKEAKILTDNSHYSDELEELIPQTMEKKELPPPPIPKVVDFIEIVDNLEDDLPEFEIDTEIDEGEGIEQVLIVEEEVEDDTAIPMALLQNPPEFPGGIPGLMRYISKHVKYPTIAVENGIKGTVYVNFIVNKKGDVVDVTLLRGTDSMLDREALKVVSNLPKWKPGSQNGRKVNVSYQVPIKFHLQ